VNWKFSYEIQTNISALFCRSGANFRKRPNCVVFLHHTELDKHNLTHTIRHSAVCNTTEELSVLYTGRYLSNWL